MFMGAVVFKAAPKQCCVKLNKPFLHLFLSYNELMRNEQEYETNKDVI